MKKKTINLIVKILRYLLPAILGWIEGDTKAISDAIIGLVSLF